MKDVGPILALIYIGILVVLGFLSDKWMIILSVPIGLLLILVRGFLENRTISRPTTPQPDCFVVLTKVEMPRDLRRLPTVGMRGRIVEIRTWSSRDETQPNGGES